MSSPTPFTSGVLTLNGRSKVAAVSRARPITLRQSGRLDVISKSETQSSRPSTFLMSSPTGVPAGRNRMPFSQAYGTQPWDRPSSWNEHIMPLDGTPRSLPLVIFTPPGRVDLCRQTGQISPTDAGVTLGAPVTICTGSSLPTSSWQIFRWSESGWSTTDRILPVTTFSISAPR